MSKIIYLVDDEKRLCDVLSMYLRKAGYDVRTFLKGEDALRAIEDNPHLWILDIMIPDIDGYQLIKEIRSVYKDTPIIFISARNADIDRILGLEMGSDDYLAKPFLPKELVLRVNKLMNRVYGQRSDEQLYSWGCYKVDIKRRRVIGEDGEIRLTHKEFQVLSLLIQHMGTTFSRNQIVTTLWGEDYYGSTRTVDDLIRRIRKKMPELRIETQYGYGYRINRL